MNNLVGVACIRLGEMILSSVRFCPEGGQFWSSKEQHILSHGRHALNHSLWVRYLNYFKTHTLIFFQLRFLKIPHPAHYPNSHSSGSWCGCRPHTDMHTQTQHHHLGDQGLKRSWIIYFPFPHHIKVS